MSSLICFRASSYRFHAFDSQIVSVLHSGFDVAFSVLLLFAFFFGRFSDSFFQPNY